MMGAIIGALWRPILGLLALLGLYAKGRADSNRREAAKDAADYIETRERMDNVETHVGDDPDAGRRWLRERGE